MVECFRSAQVQCYLTLVAAAFTWHAATPAHTALAGDADPVIVRVEEDWELEVNTPDANSAAPQVVCTISPTSDLGGQYATFEVNHQSQPFFVAGGLHLLAWDNGTATTHSAPQSEVLSQNQERITWTQTMSLVDGVLWFQVVNGDSHTWSSFGGDEHLLASKSTELPNLNAYTPACSVEHSGVSYAANRVQELVLKRVRLITDTGLVFEDDTPRTVYLD